MALGIPQVLFFNTIYCAYLLKLNNHIAVLAARWPRSPISGMDSSPDMIKKAKETLPNIEFSLDDLASYQPTEKVDLFFSNAVFQWLPSDQRLKVMARLIQSQPSGGVFAFQVPDNVDEPSHQAMTTTAQEGPWAATLKNHKAERDPFQSVHEIYDHLKPLCSTIDLWHTHYHHILADHAAVVEWVKSTGLKPFLDPLSPDEKEGYLKAYLERLKTVYPPSHDGKVILRYPRLFMVAVRA